MSEVANQLASETGLSSDLVSKGLGALLSFVREKVGPETSAQLEAVIPGAANFIQHFESSTESPQGGLMGLVTGLASKVLGGRAEEAAKLLESFSSVGFKPEQIEAFLPKALEWIKSHLPPELLQKVLASLPALAKLAGSQAEPGA
jgi:Protein of unknown function VcgC/VcgE (DUF2780)